MDRETAKRLIEALRRGYRQPVEEYLRAKALADALEWQEDCEHCRHRMHPLSRRLDLEELAVEFECSECGALNRKPLQDWTSHDARPLQPPPAS
jgi:hypothetical protein